MTEKYTERGTYFIGNHKSQWLEIRCWPGETAFGYWCNTVNPQYADDVKWELTRFAREVIDKGRVVVPSIHFGSIYVLTDGDSFESWLRMSLQAPLYVGDTIVNSMITKYPHVANTAELLGVQVRQPGDFLNEFVQRHQLLDRET